ncbi:MAG: ABC-2 family transporter protein [Elusimicrobia bacterium]|nr:ABC-2 family transporter protein [Elusimicrobiota bacterium]
MLKKYRLAYSLAWQRELEYRSTFLMERVRSLTLLVSFYFLWTTLLAGRASFLQYSLSQILTYAFGMHLLRALVLSSRSWEVISEINSGRLSAYLLRPISHLGYWITQDLADKTMNLISAVLEILVLVTVLRAMLYLPHRLVTYLAFGLAILGAMTIYFLLSYLASAAGFWTSESGGPRFCFELFLEFTAGAFFPIDILPRTIQALFYALPSPYLVFFPLNVWLERLPPQAIVQGLAMQVVWVAALAWLVKVVWRRGLRLYGAEGG